MLDVLHEFAPCSIGFGLSVGPDNRAYEVLYSARGKPETLRLRTLLRGFDYLTCNDGEFERALKIQALALNAGFQRALSLAHILIAAISSGIEPRSCTTTVTST
ncbi:hypothetical protein ACGFZG_29930 [Streptomyces antibioticus]|uniref:hypothetical protein n=1 Tax=Streptomyces antibioticus TaxID=1890 RepID=UPI00371247CA